MFPINSVARPAATRIASGRPLGKPLFRRHACQSSHGPTATTVINSLLHIAQVGTLFIKLSWFMQALAVL
jgi:cytochrome c551/c552